MNSFNARVWTIPISTFCKSKYDASPKTSTSALPEARDVTRVYNNFTRKVEETVDVKFDESNGSQVEYLVRPNGSFYLTTGFVQRR